MFANTKHQLNKFNIILQINLTFKIGNDFQKFSFSFKKIICRHWFVFSLSMKHTEEDGIAIICEKIQSKKSLILKLSESVANYSYVHTCIHYVHPYILIASKLRMVNNTSLYFYLRALDSSYFPYSYIFQHICFWQRIYLYNFS